MFNFLKKKTESPKQKVQPKEPIQEKKEIKSIVKTPKTYFEKSVEAANKGNVLAAAYVGVSYHYGIEEGSNEHPQGLNPNSEYAVKYLEIAAQKGYLKSQVDLGLIYLDADSPVFDRDKALKWITLTAKKGDAFSQYVMGHYYTTGDYLPLDEVKGYHWLLESASNGCERAMIELGMIYKERASELLNQKDFTESKKKESYDNAALSFKWLKEAADLGESEAMFYVGVYYYSGYGTKKDLEKSLYYLNLAIDNGNDAAVNFKNEHFAQEDL